MLAYVSMVSRLVAEGMPENRAISTVAHAYGLDWHVLAILYRHRHDH